MGSFIFFMIAGCLVYCSSVFVDNDFLKTLLAYLGGVLTGISFCVIILNNNPTVIDYMRGKVDVNIQETYVDSVLVKRDTIITYKK